MTYDIHWHDAQQTMLYVTYPSGWSWDDFYKIEAQVKDLLSENATDGRVDIIADIQAGFVPKGSIANHARSLDNELHPRIGLVVILYQSRIAKALSEMTLRIVPLKNVYRLANTLAEAERVIHADRTSEADIPS